MKRIFAVITAVLLILTFTGCGAKDGKESVSRLPEEICFTDGKYCIIRPESDAAASEACAKLYKSVKETSGVKLTNISETNDSTGKEIIVGNTARAETEQARILLKENGTGRKGEYIICVLGENIVIYGSSDEALEKAVDRFIADYCETAGYKVKTDLCFVYSITDMPDIMLNGEKIGTYDIVVPQYNRSYYTVMRINDVIDHVYGVTGIELTVTEDNCKSETKHSIVIGDCAREGVKKETGSDNYSVRCENGNIYINGGRNYSLSRGVEILLDTLKTGNDVTVTDQSGSFDGRNDSGYSLVWQDEFDNIDVTKWNIKNVNHGSKPRVDNSGYGSWYGMNTARSSDIANLHLQDGSLYMTATYDDKTFYGAWMDTSKTLRFTYGYAEISARIADGAGLWHDFWIWSDEVDHLEFDIMECWSYGDYYSAYLHQLVSSTGEHIDDIPINTRVLKDTVISGSSAMDSFHSSYKYDRTRSMNNEYHTFSAEWTEKDVAFYRDGEQTLYYCYADTQYEYIYERPHFFVLSMLVGSNYSNLPDEKSQTPRGIKGPLLDADYWSDDRASFIIDYIQLYQKPGQTIIINKERFN